MALIDELRKILRKGSNTNHDGEIQILIDSCKADLGIAGVNYGKTVDITVEGVTTAEMDPLIKHAIMLYCKGYFGYDENSERFKEAYSKLKIALALSVEYEVITVV